MNDRATTIVESIKREHGHDMGGRWIAAICAITRLCDEADSAHDLLKAAISVMAERKKQGFVRDTQAVKELCAAISKAMVKSHEAADRSVIYIRAHGERA